MSFKIHSVVAVCNNEGIGYHGALPWRLRNEMKYFQRLTKGKPPEGRQNAIIMGRKTWDSLPPNGLPGRYNFVLSRSLNEKAEKMDGLFKSLEEFIKAVNSDEWSSKIHIVYCTGGAEIYKQLFKSPSCGKLYLTRIMADFECDVFMPKREGFQLKKAQEENVPEGIQTENDGTQWKVEVYEKV